MTAHEELRVLFANRNPMYVAIDVSGISGQRTTKVEDLTDFEAKELLKICTHKLQGRLNEYQEINKKKSLQSKIIAIAESEGIKEPQSWDKFNSWMLSSSILKKHLNAYSLKELHALLRQLHALRENNHNSSLKQYNKAWWRKQNKLKNLN